MYIILFNILYISIISGLPFRKATLPLLNWLPEHLSFPLGLPLFAHPFASPSFVLWTPLHLRTSSLYFSSATLRSFFLDPL